MGIKQLTKLIQECAPGVVRECEMKELTGRRIAIDASMAIYQYLVRERALSDVSSLCAMCGICRRALAALGVN